MISSWSFSRIKVFEQCAYRARLAYVDRITEPKADGETPADRGTRVHDALDQYAQGKSNLLPAEAAFFRDEVIKLRDLVVSGNGETEQMWCYDRNWMRVKEDQYDRIWVRIKLDALVWLSSLVGLVVDFKTGKRDGNEIKHAEQMQLYPIGAFLRYPKLDKVSAELWYLDKDILIRERFTRDQALRNLRRWTERGARMTEAKVFEPSPSTHNCAYCPYKTGTIGRRGPEGTGHCDRNP